MRISVNKISKRTEYDKVKTVKRDNFLFLNNNVCKERQTVLLGDSITEIFNVTDLFSDYTLETGVAVYNRGISGDTSDRLYERLFDNALNINPLNLVLLIGTNDLGTGAPPQFTVGNIEKIIKSAKEKCPETNIIVEAVYPVNKTMKNGDHGMVGRRNNADVATINRGIKDICEKYGVVFADFNGSLSDKDGNFNENFTYDGLHPNARGFYEISKLLIPLLTH